MDLFSTVTVGVGSRMRYRGIGTELRGKIGVVEAMDQSIEGLSAKFIAVRFDGFADSFLISREDLEGA